jgi:endonuclease/exonuclease/phosphatase family metal-dependent hydrolase
VAGDFNHSVVWDRPNGPNNFAAIDELMRELGLRSAYHSEMGESFGRESCGTYFHTKKAEKPYHIDYVYAHHAIPVRQVSVEPFSEWRRESDHVPIIVDIEPF